MPSIQVCLTPALIDQFSTTKETIFVVIDVLRATTSFCTAFDFGAEAIVPLNSIDQAMKKKEEGCLVAAERDGLKPDFADFSNSPFDYMSEVIEGKTIYYTTTNGTYAIKRAAEKGVVAIGSFRNIPALTLWLASQSKDIILVCSGWKDNICIEDTLCAGAIISNLKEQESVLAKNDDLSSSENIIHYTTYRNAAFYMEGDSALIAKTLWLSAQNDPEAFVKQAAHYLRLKKLGFEGVLGFALEIGASNAVPVLKDDRLINIVKMK